MSTKISVGIRMRPLLKKEEDDDETSHLINLNEETNRINIYNERMKNYKEFKYTKVLGSSAKQAGVFEKLKVPELIDKVIQGYHATIFAYGQTGAGKTYTMEGYQYESKGENKAPKAIIQDSVDENLGVIPRSIDYLFKKLKEATVLTKKRYAIYCSYLQIYNEKVYDLLNPTQFIKNNPVGNTGLKLRYKYDMFAVENLYTFECKTKKDVMDLFHFGINNRFIATHKLNHASSRAHAIFTISVESVDLQTPEEFIISKLQLVDLAGSERSSIATQTGKVSRETIEINKSLFTLRQVILALTETKTHGRSLYIPYRDSKLTCLLRQSVGGNSYCLMISCLSPSDKFFEENVSTLNYSTRAAYIANKPVKNEDPKTKLINNLKGQVRDLTKELKKANEHVQLLSSLVGEGKEAVEALTAAQRPLKAFAKMEEALASYDGSSAPHDLLLEEGSRTHNGKFTINNNYNQNIIFGGDLAKPQTALPRAVEGDTLNGHNINIFMDRNYGERSATAEYSTRPKYPLTQNNINHGESTSKTCAGSPIKEVIGPVGSPPLLDDEIDNLKSDPNILIQKQGLVLNPENKKHIDLKKRQLTQLTNNLSQDKHHIIHRLIQSVTMVKEVLQSNLQLRENVQELTSQVDILNADVTHLQNENEELKDKMNIIGGLEKEPTYDSNSFQIDSMNPPIQTEPINEELPPISMGTGNLADILTPKNKMGIANEMVQLKKDKSLLERRVQNLEIENVNIHNKTKRFDNELAGMKMQGEIDDFEPVRCLLTEQSVRPSRTPKPGSMRNSKYKKVVPVIQAKHENVLQTKPPVPAFPTKIPRTSYAKIRNSGKESGSNSWRNCREGEERMSHTQRPEEEVNMNYEEAASRGIGSPTGKRSIRTSYRRQSRSTSPSAKHSFAHFKGNGPVVEMSQIQTRQNSGYPRYPRREISLDTQASGYEATIFNVDPGMSGIFNNGGDGSAPPHPTALGVYSKQCMIVDGNIGSYNPNKLINMNRVPNKLLKYMGAGNEEPRKPESMIVYNNQGVGGYNNSTHNHESHNSNNHSNHNSNNIHTHNNISTPPPPPPPLYKFSHRGKEYFDFKSMSFMGEEENPPPGTAGAVSVGGGRGTRGGRGGYPGVPHNVKSSTSYNKNRKKIYTQQRPPTLPPPTLQGGYPQYPQYPLFYGN